MTADDGDGFEEVRSEKTRSRKYDGGLPHTSEEALALAFADKHAGDARHVASQRRWYLWDGCRWVKDHKRRAREMARELCREVSERCENAKTAHAVASAKTINAVEQLASADGRLAAVVDDFDADLWLLNTPAGTWNLSSGERRDPRPGDLITKVTAAAPGGDCPLWLDFLKRAMCGDDELIAYLQRFAGYMLTGTTQEHAIFFVHGPSATGKTVFLETLASVLGDYSTVAPVDVFMASRFDRHTTDLAGLAGARLVTASETDEGRKWAEGRVKSLTGGDTIAARFMHQDNFTFKPQFKLLIAGNHKPGLGSVDSAMRRRMRLIPFNVVIPKSDRDPDLSDKLKGEWGGILGWAVEGCMAWQTDGLEAPARVLAATDQYLADEDVFGRWLDERCKIGDDRKGLTADLFDNWKRWTEDAGEHPGSARKLAQRLVDRGFERWRQPGTGKKGFRGVSVF